MHGPLRVPGFEISVSHTTGLTVVALDRERVGVDVEARRNVRHWGAVAQMVLPPLEALALNGAPDREQDAFLATWTKREALSKALETGIAVPPEWLDRCVETSGRRWRVLSLDLPCAYVGAFATCSTTAAQPLLLELGATPSGELVVVPTGFDIDPVIESH